MEKIRKKQLITPLHITIVLFVLFLMVGFLYYQNNYNKTPKNKNLQVIYNTNKDILLTNKLPLSDELGKNIDEVTDVKSYVDFIIENKTDDNLEYDIYITKNYVKYGISDNYVKFYLTNEKENPIIGYDKNIIPTFRDLGYLLNKPSSKLIYRDYIKANSSNHYKLRLWVSDNYAISDKLEYFKASIDVRVN